MSISIHRSITLKHNEKQDFSFFLAGIIAGDGHFSKITQLVICFPEKDINVAYFFEKTNTIWYTFKNKNKKAVKFVISHSLELEKVCSFIFNKL